LPDPWQAGHDGAVSHLPCCCYKQNDSNPEQKFDWPVVGAGVSQFGFRAVEAMTVMRHIGLASDSELDSTIAPLVARVGESLIQGDDFFRRLVNALPAAIYTTDAAGRITYFNDAAAALWGCRPTLGDSKWCGSWKLFWPDGRALPHDQCPMAMALKEKRPIRGMEAVAERPDGVRVPFIPFPTPIYDASGALVGGVNMLVDISDRKDAEYSMQRLASIVESSDDAIISKDLNGIIMSWNFGAERIFGYLAEEVIGKSILILIPPDRRTEEDLIIRRIRSGQRVEHYETIRQRKDGSLIDISLTVSPLRNPQGKVVGASKIARDITERRRSEAQIVNLAREAEHRSKNLLATVQAAIRLTNSDTAAGLKGAIEGRIQALARVTGLFVQSHWAGADLRTLVSQELSAYSQGEEKRALIDGPHVLLKPNIAQTIAVALHEMATNAAKYGALSAPKGQVRVDWSYAADGRLLLRWTEINGPPVKPPAHEGFGTRVMVNMIAAQPGGEMRFDWRAAGMACEIAVET
jgi:PAS domain S-box-containing protein